MGRNELMNGARGRGRDEFYTMYCDIEAEVARYAGQLSGKVVYCNCDDPATSEFFRYFCSSYSALGLAGLICTGYVRGGRGHVATFDGVGEPYVGRLDGDGDFRSEECMSYLDRADVVVTNPPFSLFKEYMAMLDRSGKRFLVIGNQNAVTYKELFLMIKGGRMWLGDTMNGSNRWFRVGADYPLDSRAAGCREEDGERFFFISGVVWFTNMDNEKRRSVLSLSCRYSPDRYAKYDNYDAIDVPRVAKIPADYDGLMGVPITFLHKYSPEQFELVGHEHDVNGDGGPGVPEGQFVVNGRGVFKRILIRRRA